MVWSLYATNCTLHTTYCTLDITPSTLDITPSTVHTTPYLWRAAQHTDPPGPHHHPPEQRTCLIYIMYNFINVLNILCAAYIVYSKWQGQTKGWTIYEYHKYNFLLVEHNFVFLQDCCTDSFWQDLKTISVLGCCGFSHFLEPSLWFIRKPIVYWYLLWRLVTIRVTY